MNTSPHTPIILVAGWLIVRNVIGWLASVMIFTENDLSEAGVYLGQNRD